MPLCNGGSSNNNKMQGEGKKNLISPFGNAIRKKSSSATIHIGGEIWCLMYAGFLVLSSTYLLLWRNFILFFFCCTLKNCLANFTDNFSCLSLSVRKFRNSRPSLYEHFPSVIIFTAALWTLSRSLMFFKVIQSCNSHETIMTQSWDSHEKVDWRL